LIDLVDFARLAELEQLVALHLHTLDAGRIYEPDSISDLADRASELIVRAWNRVLNDPRRYAEVRGSWLPDEDCPLCTLAGLSTPVDTDTSGVSSTVDT
jgi:hypothetical protein